MADLTIEVLFEAAARILLLDSSLEISFGADDVVRIKFPNTRRLADFLAIPHYLILRYFALLEKEELVSRAERIGIVTTGRGSRMMTDLLQEKFRKEADSILGADIFEELVRKTRRDSAYFP